MGLDVGWEEGLTENPRDGLVDGVAVGFTEGVVVGSCDGASVGADDIEVVGMKVGASVVGVAVSIDSRMANSTIFIVGVLVGPYDVVGKVLGWVVGVAIAVFDGSCEGETDKVIVGDPDSIIDGEKDGDLVVGD